MLSRLPRRLLFVESQRCQAANHKPVLEPDDDSSTKRESRYVKQGGKSDWWLSNRSKTPIIEKSRKLTFTDNQLAFHTKTTAELIRATFLFYCFSIPKLVDNNMYFMELTRKILGQNLFELAMKKTVYGQFVAGEDKETIKPTIHRLTESGIGSILDYAVEEDLDTSEAVSLEMDSCIGNDGSAGKDAARNRLMSNSAVRRLPLEFKKAHRLFQVHEAYGDRREGVVSARTYFYKDEANCDKYMEHFLYCIQAAGGASDKGFAAIKLTALGRPQFLLQFSEALVSSRMVFEALSGIGKDENEDKSVLELGFDENRFIDKAGRMGLSVSRDGIAETFTFMKKESDTGYIDLLDWNNLLESSSKISDVFVTTDESGKEIRLMKELSDEEEAQMKRMLQRINILAMEAKRLGVRLMIDAEQTYFQPAISRLAMEMMRQFNTENPVIFNTYQCYLKQSFNNFVIDLEQARREGFHFGAKVVRGAYMEQERARALDLGYEDPIQPDYEATSRCYHRSMDVGLEYIHSHGDANIMIASHNIDSIKYAISRMDSLDIPRSEGKVFFGQLLGMCDHVTFPLGLSGYLAYKYVPFGPVNDVMPYLSRRCQENRSLLDGVKIERSIVAKEVKRRFWKLNSY